MPTFTPRYFTIAIAFVALLMISNTVAAKIVSLGPLTVAGGIILFPLVYIFGDILTEVYGYSGSRPIIWAGFGACILMALAYYLVQIIPSAPFWQNQSAYEVILGQAPRIVLGSLIAYAVGEFTNSYVLSRMKVKMGGKYLWVRTIGSTIVGEGVDTVIFGLIAFYGVIPFGLLGGVMLSGYLAKVLIEVVMTPVTYWVVKKLKQADHINTFDYHVSYNPFRFK